MRDETKTATEVEMATGNSERPASKVDVGTHLSEQEVVMVALLKNGSEYSRNRKSENWFEQNLVFAKTQRKTRLRSVKNQAVLSSMGNVELV